MNRIAVFVDADYLFAQGSVVLAGRKLLRGDVDLKTDEAIGALEAFAKSVSDVPLLRIYWYDGTSGEPTSQHNALAHAAGVKIRLGVVNRQGQQKGVDSLIVTDMIALARNRAISDAVLLSGDEDLRVGVQLAQELGVRVHLLGIQPSRGSQSLLLLQEADTTREWRENDIAPFLALRETALVAVPENADPQPQATGGTRGPSAAPGTVAEQLNRIAQEWARRVPDSEVDPLIDSAETGLIPKTADAPLLAKSRTAIGRDLTSDEKKTLRAGFVAALKDRSTQPS